MSFKLYKKVLVLKYIYCCIDIVKFEYNEYDIVNL